MTGARIPVLTVVLTAVAAVLPLSAQAAPAVDERVRVRLDSGELLIGRLLRDSPEEIVLDSSLLGEVSIPRPRVAAMAPALPTASAPSPPPVTAPFPPVDPALALEPKPPAPAAAEDNPPPLTGELALGLRLFDGRNDRREIYLDGKASLAWDDNRLSLDADVERDRYRGQQIEDSFSAALRLDLGVDEPPTISPMIRLGRNESDGIALRQEYTVLIGTPVIDEDDGRYLRLEAGPVYYHERPLGHLESEISSGAGASWGINFAWPLFERLRFVHDQSGLLPVAFQGRGSPWVETSTGVRYTFRDGLFLRALYEVNWDGDTPADVDPLERVLRVTVGYSF